MKKVGIFFGVFVFFLLVVIADTNSGEISKGMKFYTRINLKAHLKNNNTQTIIIYYHNMRSKKRLIPVGTAVEIKHVGKKYIRFKIIDSNKKYKLKALSAHFDKYFVKTKEELKLEDISKEVMQEIKNMNVKRGMTKNEVYISRGCPSYIAYGKKSWGRSLDQVMQSDTWYYNFNRRRIEMVVKFKDDIVVEIK